MGSIYSVSQMNSYIHAMFAQDYLLNRVSVRGEISNCKYHTSGHIYFTLKDESSAIACIMFSAQRRNLRFRLSDGMRTVVSGKVGVYERGGTYQLYANDIRPDGIGALYERYEALKKELEESGMFDPAYKKPIPRYINTLGIVTAPTGAAVRDIIQIAKRRHPGIQIVLYPARVQGDGAAQSISRGIRVLDEAGVDVIIAGRGGGSIEDLWAFNEEITANAFFACSVPIISAVGHETDTVITDFVADLRAPTPSAAAELAVADMNAAAALAEDLARRLRDIMDWQIRESRRELEKRQMQLTMASPGNRLLQMRMLLEEKSQRLDTSMKQALAISRARLELLQERLSSLSPAAGLRKGMAMVQGGNGLLVTSALALSEGENVTILFADGSAEAEIRSVAKGKADDWV